MFWTPFSQPQQFPDFWMKAMKDHFTRLETMQKEMERLEHEGAARFEAAVEESAKLTKESIAYAQKLSSDWRKITFEAMKNFGAHA